MTQTLISWAVTSSFLILAVIAVRAALGKRLSAGLRYALWGLVLLRLLVPVQLYSSPVAGVLVQAPFAAPSAPVPDPGPAALQPDPAASQPAGGPGQGGVTVPAAPALPAAPDPPRALDRAKLSATLGRVWLGGAAALALALAACNLRFSLRLRRTRRPLEEAWAWDRPQTALAGGAARLRVYAAPGLPSPCLFGVLRPAIYVTPEAAGPGMLRHVLVHEATHYRHGDHIWSLLRCVALCLHWWNPLVWVSVELSRRDGELACDEGVLRRLGEGERVSYGTTLLALVTAKPGPAGMFTCATTMAGDKKSLAERFARIARAPRRVLGIAVAAVLLAGLASAVAFGQKVEPSAPPEEPGTGLGQTTGRDGAAAQASEPGADPESPMSEDLSVMANHFSDMIAGMEEAAKPRRPAQDLEQMRELPYSCDLNGNGVPERLLAGQYYETMAEDSSIRGVGVWEGDELLWSSPTYFGRESTSALVLTKQGDRDCLMLYSPWAGEGRGYYKYMLIDPVDRHDTLRDVSFTYSPGELVAGNFDPEAISAFMDEADALLAEGKLLLIGGSAALMDSSGEFGGNRVRVDLAWLERYAVGFTWEEDASNLENLTRFKAAATQPQPAPEPVDAEAAAQARAQLRDALLGRTGFTYCAEGGQTAAVDIHSVARTAFSNLSREYGKIDRFALVDLDGDGAQEAVLQVIDVAGDNGGSLILRWDSSGQPRCFCLDSYSMGGSLKADGTFWYSTFHGMMGLGGTARACFPAPGYAIAFDLLTQISPFGTEGMTYLIRGEPVSEEEYRAAQDGQDAKPDAAWHDFTAENIQNVLG